MATPVPVGADDLVGRRQELEALRSSLDAACDGAGRLVLCAGEPGIGKTRLAQELAGLALARGVAVAWGRVEVESAPFFWPWRQVLRTLGVDPAGMDVRYVGTADDGTLRVISLWESKAHADRFFTEKLGPALAKVLGPEPVGAPTAVGIDVARTYARQPVG